MPVIFRDPDTSGTDVSHNDDDDAPEDPPHGSFPVSVA